MVQSSQIDSAGFGSEEEREGKKKNVSVQWSSRRGGSSLKGIDSTTMPVQPLVSTDAGLARLVCRKERGAGTEGLDLEGC